MQVRPILWPRCAVRIDAETAGVITDIRRLNPHVDGRGDNVVPKTCYLSGERKDFVVAILVLLHHSSFRSTSIVEVPTLNLSSAL